MHKQIIHCCQDLDKAEFYHLIVKVTDIGSSELFAEIRDELLSREFTIYHSNDDTIEACFKNRYMEVTNKFNEMEKESWKYYNFFSKNRSNEKENYKIEF